MQALRTDEKQLEGRHLEEHVLLERPGRGAAYVLKAVADRSIRQGRSMAPLV
eukprot:m.150930 g.150930  ORF g.150930 m.150930 type:complete len:52 (+) comp15088_c12_seq9:2165-2320(+)